MSSVYPGAITSAGAANPGDTLAAAGHTALHNTHSDDARALATKLGTGSSTAAPSTVLRGTGAGTSAWGQVILSTDVTGVLPQGSGGTGTTTATGTGAAVYQVSPTLNTPTFTTPNFSDFTNAQHDHGDADDGGVLNGAIALQDNSIPGVKIATYRVPFQTVTTNSTQTTVTIQSGWNFITGTGANTASKAISFPTTYTTLLNVVVGHLGVLVGSDPAAIADFNTSDSGNIAKIAATSMTTGGFTAALTLDSSATLGATVREGFSWIAMGVV